MENAAYNTIDEYIVLYPEDVQQKLREMRCLIKAAAPEAGEKISWRMPTFTLNGNLVHFAAFKKHIGFYPGENGVAAFKDKLSAYKTSKGAIQLPLDQPLPGALIQEIVRFRVQENTRIADSKRKERTL